MHMKAIVPMLVMVVTVFILCWTPILIFEETRKISIDMQSTIENTFNCPVQVLQAYAVIGAQVFGTVKHIKTVFSLLAYVNRWQVPVIDLSICKEIIVLAASIL